VRINSLRITKKKVFTRSNRLYEQALQTIPLASQTFSKSAMIYPRGTSPLFIEKGEGASVWDPDGNRYIDYVLGLMPVVLGYRDPDVDAAICSQIERGIVFSLPSELEIALAEKLVELIPSAEMVRFGKNGSDVTSAAIRIARAYTGRDRVAVAGYHGWHDWYIGTTTRNLGVPQTVQELSTTFRFNELGFLEELLKSDPDGFAAVILEPAGVVEPAEGFLRGVRELTEKYGVVLVFDEIVTGFRIDLGGAQQRYGVTPDLSTFGKAMANGMPISAIVGKRRIMCLMDEIFFSGTFGGETLSIAAALATINKLEETDAAAVFRRLGSKILSELSSIIVELELEEVIEPCGVDWWPRFVVHKYGATNQLEITSLLRQELIEHGLLMGGGFNLSLAHQDETVFAESMDSVRSAMQRLKEYLSSSDPVSHLRGQLIKPVFQVR
jgi:glutamate-1-semialdehyde 2,1-aminomutase